jgi:hypothetical protein
MDNQRIFAACTMLRLDLADLVEGLPASSPAAVTVSP